MTTFDSKMDAPAMVLQGNRTQTSDIFEVNTSTGSQIIGVGEDGFNQETLDKLAEQLAGRLSPPEVIVKCVSCGQYGAIKHPCRYCGSPIDPPDIKVERSQGHLNVATGVNKFLGIQSRQRIVGQE